MWGRPLVGVVVGLSDGSCCVVAVRRIVQDLVGAYRIGFTQILPNSFFRTWVTILFLWWSCCLNDTGSGWLNDLDDARRGSGEQLIEDPEGGTIHGFGLRICWEKIAI